MEIEGAMPIFTKQSIRKNTSAMQRTKVSEVVKRCRIRKVSQKIQTAKDLPQDLRDTAPVDMSLIAWIFIQNSLGYQPSTVVNMVWMIYAKVVV